MFLSATVLDATRIERVPPDRLIGTIKKLRGRCYVSDTRPTAQVVPAITSAPRDSHVSLSQTDSFGVLGLGRLRLGWLGRVSV